MSTLIAPAPLVRTPELDEVMVDIVAGLAAVQHRVAVEEPVTMTDVVAADVDADRIQRYLGLDYTGDAGFEHWTWVLDEARAAGLRSVR